MTNKEITYKETGVDIEAGDEMVESIKKMVQSTHNSSALKNIGGFGGFFKPDLEKYQDPVFVSSVDGVGTKLLAACRAGVFDTIGQDLVNHCVNDIAVCGADPLFFLDYFSTGKLKQQVGYEIVRGVTQACKTNGVALVGGETAEMPDLYSRGEFDIAGTIVGLADQESIIDGNDTAEGDVLLGLPSNGLHTNGYTLARKVLFSAFKAKDHVDELGSTVGEELLRIHKSYLPVIKQLRNQDGVHGFSHITGGGIIGNTKRLLPEKLLLDVDWDSWERPPIFEIIKQEGNVPEEDMRATFNLGIGLIVVADGAEVKVIKQKLQELDEHVFEIGRVCKREK